MGRDSGQDNGGETSTILRTLGHTRNGDEADIARYIVVVDGSERGKKLEIGLEPVRVGRHGDNHLALPDPFVSSHHCTITFEEGGIWVTDTASTNGTFIQGERVVGRAPWPMGTALEVGGQVLRHEFRPRGEVQRSDQLAEELHRAANYVQSLLPRPLRSGHVKTRWRFLPSSDLGGDIFDYFWLDPERFAFYLLDVCGHGVGAALHSVSVLNLLRQRFLPGADFARPGQVLNALNKAFPMERYANMYFTLWYGVYACDRRTLTFASAGHPPALLFYDRGTERIDLLAANPPIGVVADTEYQEVTTTLRPGGRLYLYSDGVYEITTKSGAMWSWDEFVGLVREDLRRGMGQPETIFHDIRSLAKASAFDDDFSLLALTFLEEAHGTAALDVPS